MSWTNDVAKKIQGTAYGKAYTKTVGAAKQKMLDKMAGASNDARMKLPSEAEWNANSEPYGNPLERLSGGRITKEGLTAQQMADRMKKKGIRQSL